MVPRGSMAVCARSWGVGHQWREAMIYKCVGSAKELGLDSLKSFKNPHYFFSSSFFKQTFVLEKFVLK